MYVISNEKSSVFPKAKTVQCGMPNSTVITNIYVNSRGYEQCAEVEKLNSMFFIAPVT